MRIDFFVCNPPFGDQKCSTIGKEIVKHIKEHKVVLICGPTNITSYALTHITSVENENFPNIDYGTGIFTLNLGEALYKNHYRIKTTPKTKFWIKIYGLHNKIKEPLVIKNKDKKLSRICNNIIDCVKDKKPQNFICVCPMNGTMKYRTADFVENPFGIRWNNVFIFDCLGDINEYFSRNPCPLWDKNSNDVLWLKWGKNKNVLCLDKITNGNSKRNVNKCIVNQTTLDFIEWCNKNKQWELYHIITTAITKVFINRLWEIYNENRTK